MIDYILSASFILQSRMFKYKIVTLDMANTVDPSLYSF